MDLKILPLAHKLTTSVSNNKGWTLSSASHRRATRKSLSCHPMPQWCSIIWSQPMQMRSQQATMPTSNSATIEHRTMLSPKPLSNSRSKYRDLPWSSHPSRPKMEVALSVAWWIVNRHRNIRQISQLQIRRIKHNRLIKLMEWTKTSAI